MTCSVDRRDFLKTCSVMAVAITSGTIFVNDVNAGELTYKPYKKTLLVDESGKPLSLEVLASDTPYIFFYPFTAIPVFLVKVDLPVKEQQLKLGNGQSYTSPSGVGQAKNVVAYCAICVHQLMYPTKDYSVINYYGKDDAKCTNGVQLIKCCAHMSVYDPKSGGRRIDGPAEENLLAVVLEYDEVKKELYAVGMAGRSEGLLNEFFDLYKKELREEYGSTKNAKADNETAIVKRFDKFTASMIKC